MGRGGEQRLREGAERGSGRVIRGNGKVGGWGRRRRRRVMWIGARSLLSFGTEQNIASPPLVHILKMDWPYLRASG